MVSGVVEDVYVTGAERSWMFFLPLWKRADLAPQLRDELWPVVEAYEAAKERKASTRTAPIQINAVA